VTSLASPSKRSMTIPFDSGKCLSLRFDHEADRPLPALRRILYALDRLTSSLNSEPISLEKALTAMTPPDPQSKPSSEKVTPGR